MEAKSRNIKIVFEYDGTNYHGWQVQPNAISIQEVMEKVLAQIVEHDVSLTSSGRTDAGVHAMGQVANFFTTCKIPIEKLPYAANALLPSDIVIKAAYEVPDDFHARYSVKGKYYKYIINNRKFPSALQANREYFCPYKLDFDVMKQALDLIIGTHDFRGFMASGRPVENTLRTVFKAGLEVKDGIITINLIGDGFLYNMVRIISGTLIDVARGRLTLEDVKKALETGQRSYSGKTLPPQGLYLVEVYY